MSQPSVFISYSDKDETEKEQLLTHLGVLQSHGLLEVWSDDQIKRGDDWEADIKAAIERAHVGILLISADFLKSKIILNREVRRLLERRRDKELKVFPIIAKACDLDNVAWLAKIVHPKDRTPVWREGGIYADKELAKIASKILAELPLEENPSTLGVDFLDLVSSDKSTVSPTSSATDPSLSVGQVIEMNEDQINDLVDALLACSNINSQDNRAEIVNRVSDDIKYNIKRMSNDRMDVKNIVETCLNYPNGLQELVSTLEYYEGSSLPMQKVKRLISP